MESSALEMTDGSATPPAESEPAPPVVTACRCVLCVVVLLAFGDCWCRSAIGCTPAIAGGTKSRPLTVSAAFGCGLVATIIDVIDALIPSPVILRARTVAILAAASACWCVAVVVLRTSLWREESCFGVLLGQIGRHVPVALVALLAVLAAGISSCRAIARWPMRGGLHLQEPDDEVTALLAAPGPSALLLSVLLSGCFAKADGALSPGETLCIIFAAILTGAAGCVATRFVVHAELANLPKAFGPEALCATLLVFATIFVWCGLRHWVSQPPGGAASGRRGGMWSNSNSSGLGASLLADESTDEEGGFKSRLPPTIMKPKANSKPDTASKVPEAQAAPSPSISESGSHHDGDFHHDEAQRLAGVSARGSRARPPRRRSRAENFRRRVDDRRHDDSTDASGDDDEDRHAAVDGDEDEDRRRMPPPEPRRPAAAPPTHPSADSIPANLTGTTQQNSMLSQSVEVLAGPSSEVQGGPGAVAAAAMELRRAYRSGRERKKRNAWEGALNAFGDALTLYQAAVNSGADFAGGIPLGGGFSSSESEGVGGGVLMLGRIYNQRAQCFEKLKRWTEAVQDYDCAIDAVPAGRGRAALYANRAQVKHLLGDLEAAEEDYSVSVELGHVPATAKLRALRKQKQKDKKPAEGGAMATSYTETTLAGSAAAVPAPPPPELDISALLSALPAVPGAEGGSS